MLPHDVVSTAFASAPPANDPRSRRTRAHAALVAGAVWLAVAVAIVLAWAGAVRRLRRREQDHSPVVDLTDDVGPPIVVDARDPDGSSLHVVTDPER